LAEDRIDRDAGRLLFGDDPRAYDESRPEYPDRVYELLAERAPLGPTARVLEIGAGSGLATRRIAGLGVASIVAVEPDARLAAYLAQQLDETAVEVIAQPFEDVQLAPASFDLAISATAFHWLEQAPALRKVANLLRPGGGWAMWWTVFGDPDQPDAFMQAAQPLLEGLPLGPSHPASASKNFSLDVDARLGDLAAVGLFEQLQSELIRWSVRLDTAQLRGLYATFSTLTALPPDDQQKLLDELVQLAQSRFGGSVERRFVTAVYTARRIHY
jgi:SAM-dependent methyltransferase